MHCICNARLKAKEELVKMGETIENNRLLYETNANGEQVLVRSIHSNHPVYVRFKNRVSRPVDVWWRDFEGRRQHYVRMVPKTYFDVNTFVSHPWEFTDATTQENYRINNRVIFRAPITLAGFRHRTSWTITVCMRSLRTTSMLALAKHLNEPAKVKQLGLPRELEDDLRRLITSIVNTPPPPRLL